MDGAVPGTDRQEVMKVIKRKKIGGLMVGFVLVIALALSVFNKGTLAYLTDSDKAVNQISTGMASITVVEEVGAEKKNVGVFNDGTIDCYVRLMVTIPSIEGVAYTETFRDKNQWVYSESDGYWYYNNVLKAGDRAILYDSIKVTKPGEALTEEELYNYGDIVVYAEAVQADNILKDLIPDEGKNIAMYAFGLLNKEH